MEIRMEKPSRFPLSYSRINTFQTCPKKFEYLYVDKSIEDTPSEASAYGDRVHKSLEMYGKTGDESHLTSETKQWKSLVDRLLDKPGEKHFELKLTLTEDKTKTDWFSKAAWLRGIIDVLIVNGDTATVLDWKTGKPRMSTLQLAMFAAKVMTAYPKVDTVKAAFVWLVHDKITPMKFDRSGLDNLWGIIERQADAIDRAVRTGHMPASPGPLCNWCPARRVCAERC